MSSYRGSSPRFRRRKLQTGILKYPNNPLLVNTREMQHRHLAIKGSFRYHHDLVSRQLVHPRSVIVYLPPSYERTQQRYPVLYMHDGNNLFDPATAFMGREWRLDEALERLFEKQEIPEMIVVGIYNTPARLDEYTCHAHVFEGHPCGGDGAQYAAFVVEELKPFIDHRYRTLPYQECTGTMGSSLGAIISFYLAQKYPNVFHKVGMMSPTVYWSQHQILKDVPHFPRDLKLWVDIGTEEGQNIHTEETVASTQDFVYALRQQGYVIHQNLGFFIDYLVGHDEFAWGQRVDKPLKFLFG